MATSGQTTWAGGATAETAHAGLRWATRAALLAGTLFVYVTIRELLYWSAHDHNTLAGILAVGGFAGVTLSLVCVYGLSQLRHAVYWTDTAMWNVRRRIDQPNG